MNAKRRKLQSKLIAPAFFGFVESASYWLAIGRWDLQAWLACAMTAAFFVCGKLILDSEFDWLVGD